MDWSLVETAIGAVLTACAAFAAAVKLVVWPKLEAVERQANQNAGAIGSVEDNCKDNNHKIEQEVKDLRAEVKSSLQALEYKKGGKIDAAVGELKSLLRDLEKVVTENRHRSEEGDRESREKMAAMVTDCHNRINKVAENLGYIRGKQDGQQGK